VSVHAAARGERREARNAQLNTRRYGVYEHTVPSCLVDIAADIQSPVLRSTYSTSAYAEVPLGPGVPLGWRLTSATNHTVRHGQWIAQVAFS
jgi:hypothetical protein